ncbi:hypothetical protein FB45DRAFT_1061019 [Roridomyces roridus]|uniref:MYND-type domain-containing protein n=1 Tax=Roridomyces roridus TaxID=1738132 RepID=A0AAD7FHV8_9AGAR|nr:hypothetical protein FB45DRAFT_1061019 [Roridomyces roridus]
MSQDSRRIELVQFTLPDAEKERKANFLPSTMEIQEKYRATFGGACLACGKTAEALKICSKCRLAEYCSQKCQVSHWPSHKPACRDAPGPDIGLELTKRLIANGYLTYKLQTYAAVALDLPATQSNALDTCLVVNLTMEDAADTMAVVKARINRQERDPKAEQMLQVASIEKHPLELATTPAMRSSLETVRRNVAEAVAAHPSLSAGMGPVVMFVFTDGTHSLGFPFAIDITPMKLARERKPIHMESAMMGKYTIPMDEEHIIETLNHEIHMDKSNRFLLRSKSK